MKPIQTGEGRRIVEAMRAVLPPAVDVQHQATREPTTTIVVGSRKLRAVWVGEGGLRQVRPILKASPPPDVAVARVMSQGARAALGQAGIGWADETGAAEIAVGTIIVSRSGRPVPAEERVARWTPAVVAVAEALLCGTSATVSATEQATGLSSGSCINALRALADLKLIAGAQARGRGSARRIIDADAFLEAYAAAVAATPPKTSLVVGVIWRDLVAGLRDAGRQWTRGGLEWAASGMVAASVLAPLVTTVGGADIYVDAKTPGELDAVAKRVGLTPIQGGRLTLKPFPTVTTSRMTKVADGVRVAPWPRVYADVRLVGVRGEEAAEHLREVVRGG